MPLFILCVASLVLSLLSMATQNGFMAAVFVIISVIAYMSNSGGGSGPNRYA